MVTTYLAGAMEATIDNGRGWRKEYRDKLKDLGIDCIIPEEGEDKIIKGIDLRELKKSNLKQYKDIIRKIIFRDLEIIRKKSDFIIVKWDGEPTTGTIDEVGYNFHELHRKNYLVTSLNPIDISGWFLSCFEEIFISLDELIQYLENCNMEELKMEKK